MSICLQYNNGAKQSYCARMSKEFIKEGNVNTVYEIFAPDFINQTAPPGSPQSPETIIYFSDHLLKPAFPNLKVDIHDQDTLNFILKNDCSQTAVFFYSYIWKKLKSS